MPKVPTKPVAVGAVAAATALTLANPDLAGKKPEQPGEARDKPGKSHSEPVPAAVLDRLDAQDTRSDDDEDCTEPSDAKSDKDDKPLELLPNVVFEGDGKQPTTPAARPPCRKPTTPENQKSTSQP